MYSTVQYTRVCSICTQLPLAVARSCIHALGCRQGDRRLPRRPFTDVAALSSLLSFFRTSDNTLGLTSQRRSSLGNDVQRVLSASKDECCCRSPRSLSFSTCCVAGQRSRREKRARPTFCRGFGRGAGAVRDKAGGRSESACQLHLLPSSRTPTRNDGQRERHLSARPATATTTAIAARRGVLPSPSARAANALSHCQFTVQYATHPAARSNSSVSDEARIGSAAPHSATMHVSAAAAAHGPR